jgi:hypothetical protein
MRDLTCPTCRSILHFSPVPINGLHWVCASRSCASRPASRENGGFTRWMQNVNAAIAKRTGLTADDLPDFGYRDAFDHGTSAAATAAKAIRASREF